MLRTHLISKIFKNIVCELNYNYLLRCEIHSATSLDKTISSLNSSRVYPWLHKYEQIIGLAEVKEAQNNVMQAEKRFQKVQLDRRNAQIKMTEIQNKLRDIHNKLEKLTRGDARYLTLLTEEYEIMQEEKRLLQELKLVEQSEQDHFAALSSSLRESHEKERTQSEKTKYWSIVGSLIGAFIGIIGTSLNNHYKMKELKSLMGLDKQTNDQLKFTVDKLSKASMLQLQQLSTFLNDLKMIVKGDEIKDYLKLTSSSKIEDLNVKEVLNSLSKQESVIQNDLDHLKKMLSLSFATPLNGNIIYAGPELSVALDKMEENIEWNIKKSAIITMGVLYGGIGFVAAMVYFLLKGP